MTDRRPTPPRPAHSEFCRDLHDDRTREPVAARFEKATDLFEYVF